jgi:exonuclease SbcD
MTIADLNAAMIDLNSAKLRAEAESLDPALPTVVVGHAHVFGARVGAERLLTMGADPIYALNTFDLPGVDYVALGHIHKHQALSYTDPAIVYSGSIDRVDFGEEGEDKGWVLVEIPEKGRAEWQFQRIDARRFLTINARVQSDNATEDVIKAIARQGEALRDAVVKLKIDVPAERLAELRDDEIRGLLKGAFHIAPIERNVLRQVRDRWGVVDAGIQHARPIDALTFYLEHQQVDPERRDLLLKYAQRIIDPDGASAHPLSHSEVEKNGLASKDGFEADGNIHALPEADR